MKRSVTGLLLLVSLPALLAAQSIAARIDGDQLRVTAQRLHFLAGETLSRLRDGATVTYELQLALRTEKNGRTLARTTERFAVSYDLWEERFAVAKLGSAPRSVSHLSATAAEVWCVDNISVPIGAVGASPQVWIRFDYRTVDSATTADPSDNSGLTLSGLVDIFSRRTRSEPLNGFEEIGPVRIESLKRK